MDFVVDGMLGRLSRWLRLLGCDVKYYNDLLDDELLIVADKENRALLTHDLVLFQRANAKGLKAFFVEGEDEAEKLASVAQHFNISLEIDMAVSRCPICGASLYSSSKDAISTKVFVGTLKHYDEFWVCNGCGKVYWKGRHWEKITQTINKAKNLKEGKH